MRSLYSLEIVPIIRVLRDVQFASPEPKDAVVLAFRNTLGSILIIKVCAE